MFRSELPRVYELRATVLEPSSPKSAFQNFDETLSSEPDAMKAWRARERDLARLDEMAWQALKAEAAQCAKQWNPEGRGREQLISAINAARAYNYLLDLGCRSPQFIPRSKRSGIKTPDLEAVLNGCGILCEVKTIHRSDKNIASRMSCSVRDAEVSPSNGLIAKIDRKISEAKEQLYSYRKSRNEMLILFIIISFDDNSLDYTENYYKKIDEYLSGKDISEFDIVFYNQIEPVHRRVAMKFASVVNEASPV